jgi:acetyl esterase/lipase
MVGDYFRHAHLDVMTGIDAVIAMGVADPDRLVLMGWSAGRGVATHLYVAPREGHAWGELRHQLFKMNAELDWFEQHAMGRQYNWEPAPE